MTTNQDHDRDHDRSIAVSPAGGPLTSLAALQTALNKVDTSSIVGTGTPMLQFKREGDGTWLFGQKRIIAEDGSRWAANPMSLKWGFICFSDDNKVIGERLVSVSQPKPAIEELPDKGSPWSEQWTVSLKCLDGTDAGTEVVYKPTTVGGLQAIAGLIDAVRNQLNGGQHDGKIVPIVRLEKSSYQHGQFGKVWTPVLEIVSWMALDGPAPAAPEPPAPEPSSPSDQPRRRRVA
jgi:hypothetical protein